MDEFEEAKGLWRLTFCMLGVVAVVAGIGMYIDMYMKPLSLLLDEWTRKLSFLPIFVLAVMFFYIGLKGVK